MDTARKQAGRFSLYYRFWQRALPSAPSLVLVHGIGVAGGYLTPLGEALSDDFNVYIPDLPGFGRSVKPSHILNTHELAESLAAWIRLMRLPKPILIGNSYGCQIIAELAANHPDILSAAILQGPTTNPKDRSFIREIIVWRRGKRQEPGGMSPIARRDYIRCGLRRLVRTYRNSLDDKIEDKLPRIPVPTLVIRGTIDSIIPQEWAEQVTNLLPRGQLALIEGAPHSINFTHPREFARVAKKFIRSLAEPLKRTTNESVSLHR